MGGVKWNRPFFTGLLKKGIGKFSIIQEETYREVEFSDPVFTMLGWLVKIKLEAIRIEFEEKHRNFKV